MPGETLRAAGKWRLQVRRNTEARQVAAGTVRRKDKKKHQQHNKTGSWCILERVIKFHGTTVTLWTFLPLWTQPKPCRTWQSAGIYYFLFFCFWRGRGTRGMHLKRRLHQRNRRQSWYRRYLRPHLRQPAALRLVEEERRHGDTQRTEASLRDESPSDSAAWCKNMGSVTAFMLCNVYNVYHWTWPWMTSSGTTCFVQGMKWIAWRNLHYHALHNDLQWKGEKYFMGSRRENILKLVIKVLVYIIINI